MNTLENQDVVINLALFQRFGFYQIFDPNTIKYMFNCNIYKLTLVILSATVLCINCFGLLGLILNMKSVVDHFALFQIIIIHQQCFLSMLKVSVYIYNADKIWDSLDIARLCFLTSTKCYKYINIHHKYREKSVNITKVLFFVFCITILFWLAIPLFIFMISSNNKLQRYENISNIPFPVSVHVYNDYYFIFYAMELIQTIYFLYATLFIDIYIISISYVLIAQYEIIVRAFGNVGYERLQEHPNSKFPHTR